MTNPKQSVPLSIPIPASTAATNAPPTTGVNDVTIAPVASGASALDTKPDARTTLPASAKPEDPNAAKPAAAKPEEVTAAAASANKPVAADKKKKKKKTTKTDQTTTTTKTTASQE
jgi:hypothetical protein